MTTVDKNLINELLVPTDKTRIVLSKESLHTKKEIAQLVEDLKTRYQFEIETISDSQFKGLYLLEMKHNKKMYVDGSGQYLICGMIIDSHTDCVLDKMMN